MPEAKEKSLQNFAQKVPRQKIRQETQAQLKRRQKVTKNKFYFGERGGWWWGVCGVECYVLGRGVECSVPSEHGIIEEISEFLISKGTGN